MINKNRPTRFARNVIANWSAFLFNAVISFFLSPFVVQHLGATGYGVWMLIGGLVGYLGLLDMGIRQAVNRYIAHHRAANAHEDSSSIVSAAIGIFGFLGILAILLSGVFAYFAPIFFNIPESLVNDTRIIVVLGGLTVAVTLVGGVFGGVVTGLERFDISSFLEVLVTAVRTVAIVLVLRKGSGLVSLACIHFAASVLYSIVFWVSVHWLYPQLRLRFRRTLLPKMRTILSFSVPLSVIFLLSQVTSFSDSLVIGAFLPIKAVTFFAIASNLYTQASVLPSSFSYLMTPRISALASMGSKTMGDEILTIAAIATLAAAPIAATFGLRGESFVILWMGSAYGPSSGEILRVLAIVLLLGASRSVVTFSLTGMAKQRMFISGFAVEAALKLALSVVLVGPLGIVGVAIATLIPSSLVNLFYIPYTLAKATGVSVTLFCRKAILLPTAACIPFALASAVIDRLFPATNLAVFFVQVVLILPLVPITAWFMCLTAGEKRQIRSAIRKDVGK